MVFASTSYYDWRNVSGIQRVAHNLENVSGIQRVMHNWRNVSGFQSVAHNKKAEIKEITGDISGNEKYLLFLQKKIKMKKGIDLE